jgi:hypothetical protein
MLRLVFVQKDEMQQKERALGRFIVAWYTVIGSLSCRNANDRYSSVVRARFIASSVIGVHWRWNADKRTPTAGMLSVVCAK